MRIDFYDDETGEINALDILTASPRDIGGLPPDNTDACTYEGGRGRSSGYGGGGGTAVSTVPAAPLASVIPGLGLPPGPSITGQARAQAASLSGPSVIGQARAQAANLPGPSLAGQVRAQNATLTGPSVAGQMRANAANLSGPTPTTPPVLAPPPTPTTPARHPGSQSRPTLTTAVSATLSKAPGIATVVKNYINAGIQAMAGQMPVTSSSARSFVNTILTNAQQNGVSIASAAQTFFAQNGVSPKVSAAVQQAINTAPTPPASSSNGPTLAAGATLNPLPPFGPSLTPAQMVKAVASGYGFGPNTQNLFANAAATGGALANANIAHINTAMANTKAHAAATGQQYIQAAPAIIANGGNLPGTPAATFPNIPPAPTATPPAPSGGFANSVTAIYPSAQGTFQLAASGTTPPPPTGVPTQRNNPASLKPTITATGSYSKGKVVDPTSLHSNTPVTPTTARPDKIAAPKTALDISNAEAWDTAIKGISGPVVGSAAYSNAAGSLKGENTYHASIPLAAIYRLQGFDGLPTVSTKAEIDKAVKNGEIELFRGVAPVSKAPSSNQMAEDFRNGTYYAGDGIYGYGTYSAYNQGAHQRAFATAQGYAGTNGTIMRMTLKADARVIDSRQAHSNMLSEASNWQRANPGKPLPVVYSNEGMWAAAKGYDALKATSGVVVLNRTAVRVQDANAQDGAN